jgi:hypothetical protein
MSAINQTIEWSLMLQTLLRGGDSAEGKVLDLSEITIVDADVIRFLSVIEQEGTRLMGCLHMFASGFYGNEPKMAFRPLCEIT